MRRVLPAVLLLAGALGPGVGAAPARTCASVAQPAGFGFRCGFSLGGDGLSTFEVRFPRHTVVPGSERVRAASACHVYGYGSEEELSCEGLYTPAGRVVAGTITLAPRLRPGCITAAVHVGGDPLAAFEERDGALRVCDRTPPRDPRTRLAIGGPSKVSGRATFLLTYVGFVATYAQLFVEQHESGCPAAPDPGTHARVVVHGRYHLGLTHETPARAGPTYFCAWLAQADEVIARSGHRVTGSG